VVVVLALVALAGAWRISDVFIPLVDCGEFANQVEAQSHLRRHVDPPDSVDILYAAGRDPGPEAREKAEREYLARYRRDAPGVMKALDPDHDGLACNRGPSQLPQGPVPECADYIDQREAQPDLQSFLDPPQSVEHMTKDQAREYLARHRRDTPRVIKSMDPDGDGKACNKEPAWLPPRKAPE
jgi:hypothetical protein